DGVTRRQNRSVQETGKDGVAVARTSQGCGPRKWRFKCFGAETYKPPFSGPTAARRAACQLSGRYVRLLLRCTSAFANAPEGRALLRAHSRSILVAAGVALFEHGCTAGYVDGSLTYLYVAGDVEVDLILENFLHDDGHLIGHGQVHQRLGAGHQRRHASLD